MANIADMSDTTVGQLVAERPSRSRVFERLGIDYCCGGKLPLSEACQRKGVDVAEVQAALAASDAVAPAEGTDWNAEPMAALCDHIETTHHAYLKEELPRLSALIGKVARVHGDWAPYMVEANQVFEGLRAELEMHMGKEEQILFPMIRAMESAGRPAGHCGSINNPIHVMVMEHDDAGTALERLRELTSDYTPPAEACNTFRATLDALRQLEEDLHLHIHKENNILFPRASALEAQLASA